MIMNIKSYNKYKYIRLINLINIYVFYDFKSLYMFGVKLLVKVFIKFKCMTLYKLIYTMHYYLDIKLFIILVCI